MDKNAEIPAEVPQRIEVRPTLRDEEIRQRLEDILHATGWFISPQVEVRRGVVFLFGETKNEEFKKWASNLARNTEDVAAVVNKMEITPPPFWDFSLVARSLKSQTKQFLSSLPSILVGLVILCIAFLLARLAISLSRNALKKRMKAPLLSEVMARGIGILIFLLGVYIIFEMADLTSAAFTVIGGTGLLGIILGIAFRDITENFLASILLSIQHPFRIGDIIEVAGALGYVQSLNMRVTLLMAFDGNHIQIPNAIIYKSQIRNYTSNSNRREEFTVGIGFQETISTAQMVKSIAG